MEFPQVDLPGDMIAWNDVTEEILDVYKQSCRLKACIFVLCIKGSVTASINLMDWKIKEGDFVTLLPGTIIQLYELKEKVQICFVGFSDHCLNGVNLIQSILSSYSKILETPVIPVNERVASYITEYFALLTRLSIDPEVPSTKLSQNILSLLLAGLNDLYAHYPQSRKGGKSRKEEICREFIQLLIENYTRERQVQFYADKLHISLQHLSTTIKQVMGRNVMDLISHVVIIDIKFKLKSTNMTMQEIAYSLNFSNASFFGKYVKKHIGMSPLEYRNS